MKYTLVSPNEAEFFKGAKSLLIAQLGQHFWGRRWEIRLPFRFQLALWNWKSKK